MLGIEYERSSLKQRVMEMTEEADVLMNWLRVHDRKSIISNVNEEVEEKFEAADEESGKILECLAAEEAIEDVVYALDKAMVEGVVSLGDYLKQVRSLSRDQFFYKAMLEQLRNSDILQT
ncbi:Steadiness box [Macleaya cordata]|uniref:Steadiness box n=1 Tax=Macleaya cordata TaxID=56857 RepID=A0A200Q4H2_MACCD|nr:Steadiness box [Macleaya cordata]